VLMSVICAYEKLRFRKCLLKRLKFINIGFDLV
jgi:hypothetical protein